MHRWVDVTRRGIRTVLFTDDFPVRVSGEVRDPGSQPYTEGMTLRDLILRSGGVTAAADLNVGVARLEDPERRTAGGIAEVVQVRIDSSYIVPPGQDRFYLGHPDSLAADGDGAADFELQPYDHIFVRRIPDFEVPRVVRIRGEVEFPGEYTLRRKDERLRQLIERPGGLTSEAFAEGFRFYRSGSQVNVNLPEVLRQAGHRDDLILQPGDSMVVPEYNPVVRVQGAVVADPADVLYHPGAGVGYYVERAGGLTPGRRRGPDRGALR